MNALRYIHSLYLLFVELMQQVHLGLFSGPCINNANARVFQLVLKVTHVYQNVYHFGKMKQACLSYSLFLYAVDDSTGVINCLCFKQDLLKEQEKTSKCVYLFLPRLSTVSL